MRMLITDCWMGVFLVSTIVCFFVWQITQSWAAEKIAVFSVLMNFLPYIWEVREVSVSFTGPLDPEEPSLDPDTQTPKTSASPLLGENQEKRSGAEGPRGLGFSLNPWTLGVSVTLAPLVLSLLVLLILKTKAPPHLDTVGQMFTPKP
mmetsp:Transcript_25794/g.40378  ORF Transcript_25794/g.40378 Transcript_25794/m.40378 type:complete len:148 (-) Transcript_25794:26-469(-)|eukprot:CAMPEP_0184292540 /NCGR_PEP_ID=MMETSP1049-20130417/4268_1 /TAXON_ID=77928 /ORGANISM="Proteomonas sulcata, Strain CCMP704" /LENGTH=147 /DNA_ID=CAMNT_0026600355 /DNA_START=130 /DNA_END=573 /DNA_ORIENTATION=-